MQYELESSRLGLATVAPVLAIALISLACDRVHVGTQEHDLGAGKVVIETYDDPFDNLKSDHLYWRAPGGERETMGEQWGSRRASGEPALVSRTPLAVSHGTWLYQRSQDGTWRECGLDPHGAAMEEADLLLRSWAARRREPIVHGYSSILEKLSWSEGLDRVELQVRTPANATLVFHSPTHDPCDLSFDPESTQAANPNHEALALPGKLSAVISTVSFRRPDSGSYANTKEHLLLLPDATEQSLQIPLHAGLYEMVLAAELPSGKVMESHCRIVVSPYWDGQNIMLRAICLPERKDFEVRPPELVTFYGAGTPAILRSVDPPGTPYGEDYQRFISWHHEPSE